jgi:hypothetical protein
MSILEVGQDDIFHLLFPDKKDESLNYWFASIELKAWSIVRSGGFCPDEIFLVTGQALASAVRTRHFENSSMVEVICNCPEGPPVGCVLDVNFCQRTQAELRNLTMVPQDKLRKVGRNGAPVLHTIALEVRISKPTLEFHQDHKGLFE